jgi:hypothetical protein
MYEVDFSLATCMLRRSISGFGGSAKLDNVYTVQTFVPGMASYIAIRGSSNQYLYLNHITVKFNIINDFDMPHHSLENVISSEGA